MKVSDHFREPPFMRRGGRLDPNLGKDDFLPYEIHTTLEAVVKATFSRPISYRLVYGASGEGKTWTLSWLWRQFDGMKADGGKCLVLGVPKFDLRRAPERFLVETLLQVALDRHPDLFELASKSGRATSDLKVVNRYLRNEDSRTVLLGRGPTGRVPRLEGQPSLSLALTSDLLRIALTLVEAVGLTAHPWLLVLVDELEGPFTLQSRRGLTIFSDFLRDIFDNLEETKPNYPHVQFLFGGTLPVFEQFDPRVVQRQIDEGGVFAAFLRRTEPPFLLRPPNDSELKEIARERIEAHRKKREGPYIPYDLDAITLAWKRGAKNLGQFVMILQSMYDLALREGAAQITKEHCERVTKGEVVREE